MLLIETARCFQLDGTSQRLRFHCRLAEYMPTPTPFSITSAIIVRRLCLTSLIQMLSLGLY